MADSPAVIVVAAVPSHRSQVRAARCRFVQREAGHATENLLLEATARLAAVPVGGIDASAVASMLALPPGTVVLYVIPIGYEINGAG